MIHSRRKVTHYLKQPSVIIMAFLKLAWHGLNIAVTNRLIQNQRAQKIIVLQSSVLQNVLTQIFREANEVEIENVVGYPALCKLNWKIPEVLWANKLEFATVNLDWNRVSMASERKWSNLYSETPQENFWAIPLYQIRINYTYVTLTKVHLASFLRPPLTDYRAHSDDVCTPLYH